MEILIKSATILCKDSPFHKQKMDILLRDGYILKIRSAIEDKVDKVISAEDLPL